MPGSTIADIAFSRAWSVYLLINPGISANDERRATLERFIRSRAAGVEDAELLVVEGLQHLKKLDTAGRAGSL